MGTSSLMLALSIITTAADPERSNGFSWGPPFFFYFAALLLRGNRRLVPPSYSTLPDDDGRSKSCSALTKTLGYIANESGDRGNADMLLYNCTKSAVPDLETRFVCISRRSFAR